MDVLSFLTTLGNNPFEVVLTIMRNGGVFIFLFMIIFAAWKGWCSWVQGMYVSKKKMVLLAIDIPRMNEQSMKAVEQIIATLHGVQQGPNRKEKYWDGVVEDSFSLEIVSIDGYIQYFVRCDDYNTDIVKGAFFAQYPDAEIIEVEDYVGNVPQKYPDEKYDLWGTELVLANKNVYPIKTYEQFEHSLTGVFADPMAAILETLSRLRPGEQVWLQLVITPMGSDWREAGLEEVNKLAGKSGGGGGSRFGILGQLPAEFLDEFRRQAFAIEDGGLSSASSSGDDADFGRLTRGEQMVIEEVQKKISRLAFETKFRMMYIAPKEVMHSLRVIGSVFGAIKQFNSLDLNAFTSGRTKTSSPTYFFVNRRKNAKKNNIIRAYRNRDNWAGDPGYPMTTTELATLFHFPIDTVRAPLVARTTSKKSEPPTGLPLDIPSPFVALKDGGLPEPPGSEGVEPPGSSGPGLPIESTMEEGGTSDAPEALVIPTAPEQPVDVQPMQEPQQQPMPSAQPQQPSGQYPLHSMPGLPPGVRPVDSVSGQQAAQPAQQQTLPQNVPMQHTPQMPAQPMYPQTMPPPQMQQPQQVDPGHFAPQQQYTQMPPQQQPPAQQGPPQQQYRPHLTDSAQQQHANNAATKKNGPPTNLPIG